MRAVDGLADERRRGAGGERLGDELVAVGDAARHRDEQVASADFAAVEGHAGDVEGALARRRRWRLRSRPRSTGRGSCRALPRHGDVVERQDRVADDLALSHVPCRR